MTVGTAGIFMPMKYDETAVHEENGNSIALIELAEYGLSDGERWVFLDKPEGAVFRRAAYKGILNYESVEGAATMDEVRQDVTDMIGNSR